MKHPKISVCIPVYNGSEFIKIAIDSVLNQSFKDFELIIVDNQSTDNTVEIIKEYKDDRIKLFINETNIGMIPNWNKALSYATGDYLKILPADDFIYPKCLELQSAILDNDKAKRISFVCSSRHIINDAGKVLFVRKFSSKSFEINNFKAFNKVIRAGGNILGEGGAVMFRRETQEKVGPFNSDIFYLLDLDQWFKILLHGHLYVIADVLSAFRVSSSSASVQVADKQKKDYSAFINKIYHAKEYQITWYSYRLGLIKTYIFTQIKKLIYKFVV